MILRFRSDAIINILIVGISINIDIAVPPTAAVEVAAVGVLLMMI